jgi:flavin-dependent dehydrogenase
MSKGLKGQANEVGCAGRADAAEWDVAIVGGGPAGCATALALRSHAPGLAVLVLDAMGGAEPRLGESLPPLAGKLLEHLGVWDAFRAQGHRPSFGTAAIWGGPAHYDNDYLFAAHNAGWHLDRARFDTMLAAQAAGRGACVLRGAQVLRSTPCDSGWRLERADGGTLQARFLVDATGRQARLARQNGAQVVTVDRLAAFAQFFQEVQTADPRTLVEAFADGWWYTTGLPDGRRVAACLTDVDIARRLRLREACAWQRELAATAELSRVVGTAVPCGSLIVWPTESRRLVPAAGRNWLAVGDAASIFDPLSSQGIVKALRSGIYAAYAIADLLLKARDPQLKRYQSYVAQEFHSYLRLRAQYYGAERRWPHSEFWRRRQDYPK